MIKKTTSNFLATLMLTSLLLLYPHNSITAQTIICDGVMGENIFTTGDFGRGNDVIFPTDPGIAPGFIYTTSVPPTDGTYTLTNNMALWPSIFPAWLQIGDNSPDPRGYMMVVNASVEPGIFYEQTVPGICENSTYSFSADVINLIRIGVAAHIAPDVSFLINDVVVYTTGPVPQDEKWHTYGATFTAGPGVTSLKLTLRNNAPGGGGNDLALDNITFRTCSPSSSISMTPVGTVCEDILYPVLTAHVNSDPFALQWQVSQDSGMVWTNINGAVDTTYVVDELSAGTYLYRFVYGTTAANLTDTECSVASDSVLVDIVAHEYKIGDTLCEGLVFTFEGVDYTQSGQYILPRTAVNGCDSLVIIDLLFVPDPNIMAEFQVKPPSCLGADDGSIAIFSVSGARPPFIFFVDDSLVPPPSTLTKLPAGTYLAKVENEFGCFDEQIVEVPDGPVFHINLIEDTTIVLGHSIVLNSNPNVPIYIASWTPFDDLTCANCETPIARPLEDQTYFVTAETEAGCIDTDSVTIRVEEEPVIFIPNVFTPNNDGINDNFVIFSDPLNVVSIDRVIVFDRWGGMVAQQARIANEGNIVLWDGYTKHGKANPGVYVYLVEVTLANGAQRKVSGDVTILE